MEWSTKHVTAELARQEANDEIKDLKQKMQMIQQVERDKGKMKLKRTQEEHNRKAEKMVLSSHLDWKNEVGFVLIECT